MKYTQKELSKHAEVSHFQIRHYIRTGVLAPAHGEGSARHYGDDHAERLAVIARLRAKKIRWDEIRKHLSSKTPRDLRILVGLEAPAPPPASTAGTAKSPSALRDAADALVCVAAEALNMSPRALRPALVAVFARMREAGVTADEIGGALEGTKG
jgi:DNA-binding transcriptional MerR regulator